MKSVASVAFTCVRLAVLCFWDALCGAGRLCASLWFTLTPVLQEDVNDDGATPVKSNRERLASATVSDEPELGATRKIDPFSEAVENCHEDSSPPAVTVTSPTCITPYVTVRKKKRSKREKRGARCDLDDEAGTSCSPMSSPPRKELFSPRQRERNQRRRSMYQRISFCRQSETSIEKQKQSPSDASYASALTTKAIVEKEWSEVKAQFPRGEFLADGGFKRVYKVWNDQGEQYEALSVMNIDAVKELEGLDIMAELNTALLLSSVARSSCPNFLTIRDVFTCKHEPPVRNWGCSEEIKQPQERENYQYTCMELCEGGDMEEYIKSCPGKMLQVEDCKSLLFQMAFALNVASKQFGLRHYDVKLLNFLLKSGREPTVQEGKHPHVDLRYGIDSRIFRLRMHPSTAHVAKLSDFGTAVMRTDSDGNQVTLAQFTTLENTPPDFLILGNDAKQGPGHDSFGLGLCMLHLFTGHAPYEEILEDVVCTANLKKKLQMVWKQKTHDILHRAMLVTDEDGKEVEDEILYDTLYRYLVLFGIPDPHKQFGSETHGKKVWSAINSTLLQQPMGAKSKRFSDADVFSKDSSLFSLAFGTDKRIASARCRLQSMDGAMELLLSLVSFSPSERATPLDVINSKLMASLVEDDSLEYSDRCCQII